MPCLRILRTTGHANILRNFNIASALIASKKPHKAAHNPSAQFTKTRVSGFTRLGGSFPLHDPKLFFCCIVSYPEHPCLFRTPPSGVFRHYGARGGAKGLAASRGGTITWFLRLGRGMPTSRLFMRVALGACTPLALQRYLTRRLGSPPFQQVKRYFKLEERNSNLVQELRAGAVTFITVRCSSQPARWLVGLSAATRSNARFDRWPTPLRSHHQS